MSSSGTNTKQDLSSFLVCGLIGNRSQAASGTGSRRSGRTAGFSWARSFAGPVLLAPRIVKLLEQRLQQLEVLEGSQIALCEFRLRPAKLFVEGCLGPRLRSLCWR
jgi:hypothetical protein